MAKRKKKSKRTVLVDRLDDVSTRVLHKVDKEPWDSPACKGFLCNNHFFRRGFQIVKWNPINIFLGTSGANFRHEHDESYMTNWFIKKYGHGFYEALFQYAHSNYKLTIVDMEQIEDFWINHLTCNSREKLERDWFETIGLGQENLKKEWLINHGRKNGVNVSVLGIAKDFIPI